MSLESENFKEKYKTHPVRIQAMSNFNDVSRFSNRKDVREYIYQVMATIGLELENRFSDFIVFDDNQFKLFGREKSEKSTADKKKDNIEKFDKQFKEALESGNSSNLPTQVRPIFDFYAFKLVCPEISKPREVINAVFSDILTNIVKKFPEYSSVLSEMKDKIDVSRFFAIDIIDKKFSDIYPGLKDKLLSALKEQQEATKIQEFLSSNSSDVSSLTYSDYYSKIIECYQILIKLSYEESVEEYVRIAQGGLDAREELSEFIESGKSNQNIDPSLYEDYSNRLQELLEHISRKKTNKLDLALGDLMLYDVLTTSKALKNLGVSLSEDSTRSKKKRNPNGYIANFYSFDMPNGLTSEIQLQSLYRYTYGESGPAAHNKMENGRKKRTLYTLPKDKSKYQDWAKKQFKALPKYFRYLGHGFIQVYSTLQNFRRYYDTEKPEEVQTYVKFIAEHDIDQLDSSILHFSLEDAPTSFQVPSINIDDDSNSR